MTKKIIVFTILAAACSASLFSQTTLPAGQKAVVAYSGNFYSSTTTGTISAVDGQTGKVLWTTVQPDQVQGYGLCGSNQFGIAAGMMLYKASTGNYTVKAIRVFDPASGKLVASVDPGDVFPIVCATAADGSLVFASSLRDSDNPIVPEDHKVAVIQKVINEAGQTVTSVTRLMADSGGIVAVWTLSSGRTLFAITNYATGINELAWSDNGGDLKFLRLSIIPFSLTVDPNEEHVYIVGSPQTQVLNLGTLTTSSVPVTTTLPENRSFQFSTNPTIVYVQWGDEIDRWRVTPTVQTQVDTVYRVANPSASTAIYSLAVGQAGVCDDLFMLQTASAVQTQVQIIPYTGQGGAAVNGASFAGGAQAPGTLVSAFGVGLGTAPTQAPSLPLPRTLGGATVLVNGIAAPLLYVSPTQINYQIPYELGGSTADIIIQSAAGSTTSQQIQLAVASPGVFQCGGLACAQHANYTMVSSSNPAKPGETVILYVAGLGRTAPSVPSGTAAPTSPLALTVTVPTVTIGNQPAAVSFSGLTPGFAGLYQLNVAVPLGLPTFNGAAPVVITAGALASPTAKLAVTQ